MRSPAAGALPAFPTETRVVREGDWTVAPPLESRGIDEIRLQGLEGYAAVAAWVREFRGRNPDVEPEKLVVEVVIDTVWAALEAEEILYELRDFAVRLRASPFGFLFSMIRMFSVRPEFVLPDRSDISATTPCIDAYFRHLRDVCERRGTTLLGAPDPRPSLFDDDRQIAPQDLLQVPRGRITEPGVRANMEIAMRYLSGDADIDRVDAEFARAQLWQWVHRETGVLDTGRIISDAMVSNWLAETEAELRAVAAEKGLVPEAIRAAASRLAALTMADPIPESIDPEAYPLRA